jgi:DNA-directed RNA polymerase subunit N
VRAGCPRVASFYFFCQCVLVSLSLSLSLPLSPSLSPFVLFIADTANPARLAMSTRPEIIMPCRCYSCNKPVGHLWDKWQQYMQQGGADAAAVLDVLGLRRYCCRRMILSHTDQVRKPVKGAFMRPTASDACAPRHDTGTGPRPEKRR